MPRRADLLRVVFDQVTVHQGYASYNAVDCTTVLCLILTKRDVADGELTAVGTQPAAVAAFIPVAHCISAGDEKAVEHGPGDVAGHDNVPRVVVEVRETRAVVGQQVAA